MNRHHSKHKFDAEKVAKFKQQYENGTLVVDPEKVLAGMINSAKENSNGDDREIQDTVGLGVLGGEDIEPEE